MEENHALIIPTRYADVAPVITIQEAIERHQQLAKYVGSVMIEGHDYGTIPGASKPSLQKPGAEKLTTFFGLTKRLFIVEKMEDWAGEQHSGEPFFYYLYRCALYRGELLIAEADGSCNSRETKYRWREMQRTCPACHSVAIIRGKEEFGGGWVCFQKKGGCGAKFALDDPAISAQQVGRIANPDIADQVNTIQKMAAKRALVAATLLAVNASEFFTQDMEDFSHEPPPQPAPPTPTGNDRTPRTPPPNQPAPAPPKNTPPPATANSNSQARAMPAKPLASSVSELATPRQCTMIRALARALELDADAEVSQLIKLEVKVEELNRRAASVFIDHLKQLEATSSMVPQSGAREIAQPLPMPSPVPSTPPSALTLVEPTTPRLADPFADLALEPPALAVPLMPPFNRDEAIAEIKNTVLSLKFATTLPAWREFERGLLGRSVTEVSEVLLQQAVSALRKAASNTEIITWHAARWVGEMEQKCYLMGLIVMHAEVDGFEKTRALVGNPAVYRSPERIDITAKNLLSWVRPDQLQEAA